MKVEKQSLINAIKFLLPAVGLSKVRRNLMNLHVKKEGHKIILTAANSKLLKRETISEVIVNGEETEDCSFLIPSSVLKNYLYMLEGTLFVAMDFPLVVEISPTFLSLPSGVGIKYTQPSLDFPDLENLIKGEYNCKISEIEHPNRIGIEPNLLIDAMIGFDDEIPPVPVVVKIKSPTEPVYIESQDGTRMAIVMPIIIKW